MLALDFVSFLKKRINEVILPVGETVLQGKVKTIEDYYKHTADFQAYKNIADGLDALLQEAAATHGNFPVRQVDAEIAD